MQITTIDTNNVCYLISAHLVLSSKVGADRYERVDDLYDIYNPIACFLKKTNII